MPECGKEARRGSSWCKLHEDEALANDSAMVPPTFEGVYSALALIDDIKNDYLSPEWTGSVPEMLDDNVRTIKIKIKNKGGNNGMWEN